MGKERSIEHQGVTLYYQIMEERERSFVTITGCSRLKSTLTVPATIEKLPVERIEKKAFLGQESLLRLTVPESVNYIGDWAMSQCRCLTQVYLLNSNVQFGKGILEGCKAIREIYLKEEIEEKSVRDLAILLGLLVNSLSGEYLLNDTQRGSREWFTQWDLRLAAHLAESDEDGYMKLALCGEEDIMLDMSEFIAENKRRKAGLCLLRLCHDTNLESGLRQVFADYLVQRTKGCETEEAWQALFLDFAGDVEYYETFAKTGAVHENNVEAILLEMGQQFAEAKAFLLKYREENFAKKDFFDQFVL